MNRILEIIAVVLARPQCAQKRAIILHRLEPVLDLLRSFPKETLEQVFRLYLEGLGHSDLIIDVDLLTSSAR